MVLVDDGLKSKTIDGQDKPGKGKDEKSQGENPEADAGDKWHGAGGMAETYACSVNNNNEVRLLLAFSCSIPSRSPSASALCAPYFPASLFSPPSTSTTTRANLCSSIQHCSQRRICHAHPYLLHCSLARRPPPHLPATRQPTPFAPISRGLVPVALSLFHRRFILAFVRRDTHWTVRLRYT